MLCAKAQVLLERVTNFYANRKWQGDDCYREWLELVPLLSKLELEEATEAFEMLTVCVLMSKSDAHHAEEKAQISPLDECLLKLKRLIAVGFWAKIIEIELSTNSDIQAKMKVTELVATLPQFSRSAIKASRINSSEFPLSVFAITCLQESSPNKSRN